ncbi:Sialin [Toxocara canis]|uniref:Sialin n=1 Tax=Toxocara canis TaxID=6265 RepID=A0A0B2VRJ6_TOXCA|nr:Sialin [Toxocara canis]
MNLKYRTTSNITPVAAKFSAPLYNELYSSSSGMLQSFSDGCGTCFTRTRFVILPLVLFCLSSLWANILCFNIALLCINPHIEDASIKDVNTAKQTRMEARLVSDFASFEKIWLTGAVALGAICAHFPLIVLMNRFGVRIIFSLLGLLSGVATLFMPLALRSGYAYIIVLRVLQGMAFASNFMVIGAFGDRWTYYKQNGLFISLVVSYVQVAPTLSNPISGALCSSSLGWPSIFYAHGIFTVVLFIVFLLFYRNTASKHPLVGDIEAKKIQRNKVEMSKDEQQHIPYASIFTTVSVWAVWIAAIGNFYCVNTVYLFSPNYFHRVLKMEVSKTGLSAALPSILQFIIKVFAGLVSDKIRFFGETAKLRIFNSVAFFGSTIFVVIVAFLTMDPINEAHTCMILLSVTTGMLGIATGGFFKAGPMISGHFSEFVTGNISLAITVTMFVVPFIISGVAPTDTAEQWRTIFLITGAVMAVTNILFVIFVDATPPSWAKNEKNADRRRSKVYSITSSIIDTLPHINNSTTSNDHWATPINICDEKRSACKAEAKCIV